MYFQNAHIAKRLRLFFAPAALFAASALAVCGADTAPKLPNATSASASASPSEIAPLVMDWRTDFDEARKFAQASGKDMLVAFVSVDSSIWSRRLDSGVFGKPDFAAAIAPNFVCVLLEFPRTYSLPSAVQRKNEQMRSAWNVATFPTLFLADKNGRPYAVTGFRDGDATTYAQHLLSLRSIRERRDQNFSAAAKSATNIEQATLLAQALEGIDENILLHHYRAELGTLKRIDPQDSTGMITTIEFMPKIRALNDRITQLIRQKKDYQGALNAVDAFIVQKAPVGEHLQRVLFLKLLVYGNREVHNHDAIIKLMDTIIAVNPESGQGKMAGDVRQRALAIIAAKKAEEKTAEAAPDAAKKPEGAK